MKLAKLVALVATLAAVGFAPAQAAKIRIGYWNSGVSLGFGADLEAGKFMEKQGFDVDYVKFPDVNAPTKAMAAGSIDLAFGASAGSALSVAADGLPMSIVLVTQVADLDFVVLQDSPINSLSELKGKKVGNSPAGSATAAITTAILANNYGITSSDFQAVPGNDPRLAQFLVQKDIDAAALRTVTLALLPDVKLKKIGSFREEWKKLTKKDAPPVLGVALMSNEWLKTNATDAGKVVAAIRNAFNAGKADKDGVAKALVSAGNIPEAEAKAYAALWDGIYTVSMEPADIASLKAEFDIFKSVGAVKGTLPDTALPTAPYEQSKSIK